MRSYHPLVAAACLLAAPLASAAPCGGQGMVNITAQRGAMGAPGANFSTGTELAAEVVGSYALSNGHTLRLFDLDQQLYAEFDNRRRVRLEEVGPHAFASRQRNVQLLWMPGGRTDTILLSYPADSEGRFQYSCP